MEQQPNFADEVQKKRQAQQQEAQGNKKHSDVIKATDAVQAAVIGSAKANIQHRDQHEPRVDVKNMPKDYAKDSGIKEAVDAINKLNLTTFTAAQPRIADLTDNLTTLVGKLDSLTKGLEATGLEPVAKSLNQLLDKMNSLPKEISDITLQIDKGDDQSTVDAIKQVESAVKKIKLDPKVNVASPTVNTPAVDLGPLQKALTSISKGLDKLSTQEQKETDLSPLIDAVNQVTSTIGSLRFPVPNYVLPFKDSTGKDVQVQLDASGNVPLGAVTVTGGATAAKQDTGNTSVASIDTKIAATGAPAPASAFYQGVNPQTALPTAATAGNLTGVTADKFGRQVVLPGTVRDLVGTQTTTISASTAETTVVTQAASTFNDVTTLIVSNTSATATRVDFRDTTGGSVLFSLYVPAGDMRGVSPTRPLPQTTVNTNWTAQSSASVTDLRVYVVFDKNK